MATPPISGMWWFLSVITVSGEWKALRHYSDGPAPLFSLVHGTCWTTGTLVQHSGGPLGLILKILCELLHCHSQNRALKATICSVAISQGSCTVDKPNNAEAARLPTFHLLILKFSPYVFMHFIPAVAGSATSRSCWKKCMSKLRVSRHGSMSLQNLLLL